MYYILFYFIILYYVRLKYIISYYFIIYFKYMILCYIMLYFLVLVNIYILINIYIINIIAIQNYASVPFLFIVIILSKTHTWFSKSNFVKYEVHCTCHVQARSVDFYICCYSFFATLLKFLLNFPRVRHATLL